MRVLLLAMLMSTNAAADEAATTATKTTESRHVVYVEAFGKGGAYGLGFERAITPRLSLGVVGSFVRIRGQDIATASPYLHATLRRRGKHALFGELGAVLVHSRIESPVMSWDGMSDTGGGGVAALGWERRGKRTIVRAQGSILVGEGGIAPWGGLAIGFRP